MSTNYFLRGAALGALFASVTTLLLAPKTGKKTRDEVQHITKNVSELISKELDKAGLLSREKYEDIIRTSLKEYGKGKRIAEGLVHDLGAVLSTYFDEVKDELKSITPAKKPAVKKKSSGVTKKKKKA
ncbi:MAG: hypothetical protein Q7S47_00780 [bacterium]|nr:hypothetical protein [bacterium]